MDSVFKIHSMNNKLSVTKAKLKGLNNCSMSSYKGL